MAPNQESRTLFSAFESPTFGKDVSFHLDKPVGSASISPCGRDIVLASRQGLHIIDLDSPYSPPRHLPHHTPWEVADVQWSPFSSRDSWVISTSNQKALLWNLEMRDPGSSVEHVLHAHSRAITDINFSAHHPDILATCAVDSFVHCWDIRHPRRPAISFSDWFAGATQVKWNRQDSHILASSHDKLLRIWDDRKGAYPLRSIEAHSTKIYGVDWNRTQTHRLVTCSLDRTVKFWDYKFGEGQPEHVIQTPFPVWRARYTPFGSGLLAMPQRGNNELHLYDRRSFPKEDGEAIDMPVHSFEGHDNQVKEFLWRSRGTISEGIDSREFQLVSWGTDKMLRLHKLDNQLLSQVGYVQGQEVKAHFNMTRKNAVYKSFRDNLAKVSSEDQKKMPLMQIRKPNGMRARLTKGSSNGSLTGHPAFVMGVVGLVDADRTKASQDMDPITWMKGVRIGKRVSSPSALHRSLSPTASSRLTANSAWDRYDSIGEEITHVADKFSNVKFDEIDMWNRRMLVSLYGPWGLENKPCWIKCRLDFPEDYPNSAAPRLDLERVPNLREDRAASLLEDIGEITAAYCHHQLGSLEAVIRYLLGERRVEDLLTLLEVPVNSELDVAQRSAASSSDEDDDEIEAHDLDTSLGTLDTSNAGYNIPLPKACGALWSNDGRLVCFFPRKEEKIHSLLDTFSIQASEYSLRSQKSIFENFGHLSKSLYNQRRRSSSDSESTSDHDITSSSGSSSSSEVTDIPNQLFLPSIALGESNFVKRHDVTLVESQYSGGAHPEQNPEPSPNYVCVHDFQDTLPSKKVLAQRYILSHDRQFCCRHNASVAEEAGYEELADVWSLVALICQKQVSQDAIIHSHGKDPRAIASCRDVHPLRSRDSAIDLSFDSTEARSEKSITDHVGWDQHPFWHPWVANELISYFEMSGDVQMLAMLTCVLSKPPGGDNLINSDQPVARSNVPENLQQENWSTYSASGRSTIDFPPTGSSSSSVNGKTPVGTMISNVVHPVRDRRRQPPNTTTPSISFRHSRSNSDYLEPQNLSLSTSPEQLRHVPKSNSNLATTFAASLSRQFSFSTSTSSSPPTRKGLSPADSYLGVAHPGIAVGNAKSLGQHPTLPDIPRTPYSLPASDTEEEAVVQKPIFRIARKNEGCFDIEGHTFTPALDQSQEFKAETYRDAYGEMLFAWDLPLQMCEVLRHNGDARSHDELLAPGHPDLKFRKASSNKDMDVMGLGFVDVCLNCNNILPSRDVSQVCLQCSAWKPPMVCLFCESLIKGLASACLACGHVLHVSCRAMLQGQDFAWEDEPDHESYTCVSGCGCPCNDYVSVEIADSKEENIRNDSEVLNTSTESGPGGEVFEQKEDRKAWPDVAYESLARNLGGRHLLTPKTSQIWRGGDGAEAGQSRKKSNVGSSLRYE